MLWRAGTYHVYHVALPHPVTPSLLTAPVNLVPRAFVKALGTRLSPQIRVFRSCFRLDQLKIAHNLPLGIPIYKNIKPQLRDAGFTFYDINICRF